MNPTAEWLMSVAETILVWSNAVYAVAVLGAAGLLVVMWVVKKVRDWELGSE